MVIASYILTAIIGYTVISIIMKMFIKPKVIYDRNHPKFERYRYISSTQKHVYQGMFNNKVYRYEHTLMDMIENKEIKILDQDNDSFFKSLKDLKKKMVLKNEFYQANNTIESNFYT